MDTIKINIDGNEVEFFTSIKDDMIENNRDLFNEDTIDLSKVIREINTNGDNYE